MLTSLLCIAPPALHPRTAALLGDTATLHFFPDSILSSECAFKITAETVDRCYIELPDSLSVHPTFLPELMRVLKKGGKVCVRHRNSMNWTDTFIFRCCSQFEALCCVHCLNCAQCSGFVDAIQREGDGVTFETTSAKPHWLNLNLGSWCMPLIVNFLQGRWSCYAVVFEEEGKCHSCSTSGGQSLDYFC